MRDHKTQGWVAHRDGMHVDRVREPHVEQGWQAEFLANSDAQYAAMHKSNRAGPARRKLEQGGDAIIVHRVAMHRWEETKSMHAPAGERRFDMSRRVCSGRIHHHIAKESL